MKHPNLGRPKLCPFFNSPPFSTSVRTFVDFFQPPVEVVVVVVVVRQQLASRRDQSFKYSIMSDRQEGEEGEGEEVVCLSAVRHSSWIDFRASERWNGRKAGICLHSHEDDDDDNKPICSQGAKI